MDEISKRLWDKHEDANAHPPRRALEAAMDQIAANDQLATHIIVVMEYRDGDKSGQRIFQAGTASEYDTVGMLQRASKILLDDM